MTTIADFYAELDNQELSDIAARTDNADEYLICDQIMTNRTERDNPVFSVHVPYSRAGVTFQRSLVQAIQTGQTLPDTADRGEYPTAAHRVRCWISRTNERRRHIVGETLPYA